MGSTDAIGTAATKKASSLMSEFRQFAFKGNVIDLAIGVIIGAAFGKIVDSMVKNVLMPLIAVVMPGEGGYQSWSFVLAGKEVPYGLFLGEVVNFLVVAFALFLLVAKVIGPMVKARQEPPPPPAAPAPTKDQELLAEIRDLLRARQNV